MPTCKDCNGYGMIHTDVPGGEGFPNEDVVSVCQNCHGKGRIDDSYLPPQEKWVTPFN